jgi:hypothetical protein
MIAIGVICDPLLFCKTMRDRKQPFSINTIGPARNVVCTSFAEFIRLNPTVTKKRIIIFDALEKLKTIQNIIMIKNKLATECVNRVIKENKHITVSIKNHDYIVETIDKNNDSSISFLHEYNTNLYNITSVATRESIRSLYFSYLHARIPEEKFIKELNALHPKRGKSVEAFLTLKELVNSSLFKKTQEAIKFAKGKHDRELDAIAKTYGIAAFDLRYFLYSNK